MAPRRSLAVACALTVVLLAGCSSRPEAKPYVYHPDDSPVDVDTQSLRDQKAASGIEPCPQSEAAPDSSATNALPSVTLPCLGGGRDVHLAGLAGVPTVINVWAQNCGPCVKESPIFQKVHEAAADKVAFLGIDFKDPLPSMAIGFADQFGITYPQVADPEGATQAALEVRGLPTTILVDGSGKMVYSESIAITSQEELTDLISEHLGVDVSATGSR